MNIHALKKRSVILALLFICSSSLFAAEPIKNYSIYLAKASYQGKDILVLRKFEQAGRLYFLVVDPRNLESNIIHSDLVSSTPISWKQALFDYRESPYAKALQAAERQSASLQDAGIVHGYPKEKGVTLTVDLCPSHKTLDRIIFKSLISEFGKTEKPVPLALSVTGRFILTHAEDIDWIKKLIKSGDINVTWINHTYNHHFNPKAPLKNNFILEPGTDLNFEILGTELAMLQQGLIPSVFFRFPGLVSDRQVADKVISYGLIPIGSDAWLAKGQPAHSGSIVLIHGNGNEPLGVKDFISLLQTEKTSVLKKEWLMYDLKESVKDEFEQ